MMVSRPEQWVKPMAAAGANQYTFHLEATTNPGSLIKDIRETGMKVRKVAGKIETICMIVFCIISYKPICVVGGFGYKARYYSRGTCPLG